MDIVLQIVLIIVPSGLVFGTAYFMMNKQIEKESRNANIELKRDRQKSILPMRVDAYQRLVLLMERISPNSLVMRLHNPALPAKMFQAELLKAIREEYEHNVAQQIFISHQLWEMVQNAKEETIKIINIAGNQVDLTSTATELSAKIFEITAEFKKLPTQIVAQALKEELQKLF
jgi:hypothetical protein